MLAIAAASIARAVAGCSSDEGIKPVDGGSDGAKPDGSSGDAGDAGTDGSAMGLGKINHFIIIYLENHSFDNLYGEFAGANGLNGLDASAPNVQQVDDTNTPYATLPPPPGMPVFPNTIPNGPFAIESYVPADAATQDLHHIFWTEQFQINAGSMNRYVYWSDAKGLTMGFYHTANLPLANIAKNYVLCDNYFHAAFGGSFLNHQFLIAARAPVFQAYDAGPRDLPDAFAPGQGEKAISEDGYVVNTAFSVNSPHPFFNPAPAGLVPNQTHDTIGDRMSAANVSWAWYSGGWNDALSFSADGGVPDGGAPPNVEQFQYHHQPFIYFSNYADGTPGRAQHLKDESDFLAAISSGTLPQVSFWKPVGISNEHPGYTDLLDGEKHTSDVINMIKASTQWKDTAIIVTYDENGGFWDHVKPPTPDRWGPGTRVPAIIISPFAKTGIDHTQYDTMAILATIEHRFTLPPLQDRDKNSPDMSPAFDFTK